MNATSLVRDPSDRVRLAPGAYLAVQDDTARVLDLDEGRFYGLDAIGTRLLLLALRHGRGRAAEVVVREHGVWFDDVRADLEALIGELARRGLVEGTGPKRREAWLPLRWLGRPGRVPGGAPSVRLAGRLLRRAWLGLRLHGWAGSLERWGRPVQAPAPVADRMGLIDAIDRAIRDAAARSLLFAVACKERALVAYHLLKAVHGLPAELIVGVQHYPFLAHAWVEIEGRVVTDDAGHCEGFVPVARYGAVN